MKIRNQMVETDEVGGGGGGHFSGALVVVCI